MVRLPSYGTRRPGASDVAARRRITTKHLPTAGIVACLAVALGAQALALNQTDDLTPVLVAAHDISDGTLLEREDVEIELVPSSEVSPLALAPEDDDQVEGAILTTDLSEGEPLSSADLPGTLLQGRLTPDQTGRTLVSTRLTVSSDAARSLKPGTSVQLVVAAPSGTGGGGGALPDESQESVVGASGSGVAQPLGDAVARPPGTPPAGALPPELDPAPEVDAGAPATQIPEAVVDPVDPVTPGFSRPGGQAPSGPADGPVPTQPEPRPSPGPGQQPAPGPAPDPAPSPVPGSAPTTPGVVPVPPTRPTPGGPGQSASSGVRGPGGAPEAGSVVVPDATVVVVDEPASDGDSVTVVIETEVGNVPSLVGIEAQQDLDVVIVDDPPVTDAPEVPSDPDPVPEADPEGEPGDEDSPAVED